MKKVYIISYDLRAPGRNYDELHRRIHSYGTWAVLGGSAYLVVTNQTAVEVRDYLWTSLDQNDKLFVGTISAPAAWNGLEGIVSDWIRQHVK